MTPGQIIAHRRRRLLDLADQLGNISQACRQMGISRTRYYQWKKLAEAYGLEALEPKTRRRPALPNATPTHVVSELLSLTIAEPTIGCRQLADALAERGYVVSKTTTQKILTDHNLGQRSQRVARAAAVAAATTGLVTEAVKDEPFGFCHWASNPGALVAMDSFYVGNLKGVGKVYQLTAVDTATRWAMVAIILGPVTAAHTAAFLASVVRRWRRSGCEVRAVLTDNGPEYVAGVFTAALAAKEITHKRIPPRSPNHNAVCERFHGTILQECWRRAFHRRRFTSIRQLQAEADAWLIRYNTRRRNHGAYMRSRTPAEMLAIHTKRRPA